MAGKQVNNLAGRKSDRGRRPEKEWQKIGIFILIIGTLTKSHVGYIHDVRFNIYGTQHRTTSSVTIVRTGRVKKQHLGWYFLPTTVRNF